jgi:hypothetical protein
MRHVPENCMLSMLNCGDAETAAAAVVRLFVCVAAMGLTGFDLSDLVRSATTAI